MKILFVVMKMKRTNGICIFLGVCIAIIILFTVAMLEHKSSESEENLEEERILLTQNETRPSVNAATPKFMVLLEDDVIVVYEIVDWKKYLTTDITRDTLPDAVVEDLRDGIDFFNEKELYSFLENYSS